MSRNPTFDKDELMDTEYGIETDSTGRHTLSVMVGVITRSKAKQQVERTDDLPPPTQLLDDLHPQPVLEEFRIMPDHFDITKLKEEQQKDPVVQHRFKEVQQEPHKHPYVIQDGILYKLLSRAKGQTKAKLIYLLSSMIHPALRSYHDHPTSAHFSVHRTYAKMKYKYWWPDMQRYIIDYINSCIACKQHNYSRQKTPGHLHPITPLTGPFQVIGIDYCGPFLTTSKENKYVLCT
ncbi:unnamed protein product [Didymodactylos carnosus]|uniref:Integrase zinc-binding domain-containing protein n=1 Tax=Didymodactylos carnosus TaxID=1234261 RepID=A0A8S2RYQ8_9BILA|nr:unnamed protein product [Didymodactylos carnosus]CAF4196232.1 unnamed protein product [Didymodactylos carnosus]